MKENHFSDSKSLIITFHRDGIKRTYSTWFGEVFSAEDILEAMGVSKDNVGKNSLEWFENWCHKNSGSRFTTVDCFHAINQGDWTIKFICDV